MIEAKAAQKPDIKRDPNAWSIRLAPSERRQKFWVSAPGERSHYEKVVEGDALLLLEGEAGEERVSGFARVFRIRSSLSETFFYFDGVEYLDPSVPASSLGITVSPSSLPVSRLDWSVFSAAMKAATGLEFAELPLLSGEYAYLRELLQLAVIDDLLGPAGGPYEEIVDMKVTERYLLGKLAPRETVLSGFEDDRVDDASEGEPDDLKVKAVQPLKLGTGKVMPPSDTDPDEIPELDPSTNRSLVPSSLGMTFCVDSSAKVIEVEARWGRYERVESKLYFSEKNGKPKRVWKRIPSGGQIVIRLEEGLIGPLSPDPDCPAVIVKGLVRPPSPTGDRLVTLFLVNAQDKPGVNEDAAWVFQPELIVRDVEGRAVFQRRQVLEASGEDLERESLEMLYRDRVEFAVGHGVAVSTRTSPSEATKAVEVRTAIVPQYEVPVTETPGSESEDRPAIRQLVDAGFLDMSTLASLPRDELIAGLGVLTDDYANWIAEQEARISGDVQEYEVAARHAIERCGRVLDRLKRGVEVLRTDGGALEAFRFANSTMASQRVHGIYALRRRRGEEISISDVDIPRNRSWRPFQLAFLLLAIPSLADPTHPDRTESLEANADLLWFPTGGGKTEAYLGVAAFAMAVRRLQRNLYLGGLDSGRGLAVIMRYTLRLLTLQQFQRASTLVCAMEVARRKDPEKWGDEPFSIGLWVGQKVTPNTTEESHEAINNEREGRRGTGSSPSQLTTCPWCGLPIDPKRNIVVDKDTGRTLIFCSDKLGQCDFSRAKSPDRGLPVVVVDEEIYRRPPSMLIATVDKFALMAWRGEVRTLFGRASRECPRHGLIWPESECQGNHTRRGRLPATAVRDITPIRPPDLIIQDEFHLISGPLGTMVGLYETAIDALSSWRLNDETVRPKVIASTATVRKAPEQVRNVFLRQVSIFPPHGIDIEDNFFSVQRPVDRKPGRRYLGICAPGSSKPATLIRVYVAALTAAQALFERFEQDADPYMTAVGYFNALRELGGMKRLAEDDVQTRSYRVQMSDIERPGLAQRAIRVVEELTSRVSSRDIPKKLDLLEVKHKKSWVKDEDRAIDIVLATNMLSVGVDVNRLGLMIVNGQPKTTAEYIQATSRVGRSFPGLVFTVLAWSRPRDLSHYETFEHYHATFYKHVEAQSVTPFSHRALDRGLTGTMVSLLRMHDDSLNPNRGAEKLDRSDHGTAVWAKEILADRASRVTAKMASGRLVETMTQQRVDSWAKKARQKGVVLAYEREWRKGTVVNLLQKPGADPWAEFTVPMSMREVEPNVRLVMDGRRLEDDTPWRAPVADSSEEEHS